MEFVHTTYIFSINSILQNQTKQDSHNFEMHTNLNKQDDFPFSLLANTSLKPPLVAKILNVMCQNIRPISTIVFPHFVSFFDTSIRIE